MSERKCAGCGAPSSEDTPIPSRCHLCPPDICDDCGKVNHPGTERMCDCWVSLEGMPLADLKALFALGDLSLAASPAGQSEGDAS
jgi:hypothetical protein